LAEVASFRPRDLTIEVGAGLRLQRLRELVEENGLWIPAAGIGADRSIGGWIAASSPAVWDAAYGPVRRQLLGCRVTAPDGRELTWGRAVMKNVAGYDFPRLMAGSRGRLGILTRVTVRLWPRPEAISAWVIRGDVQRFMLESTEADAVAWKWTRSEGVCVTAMFVGSAKSVLRRERALATRVRASGAQIREVGTDGESADGKALLRPRSVVCRLTAGRRGLRALFDGLVQWNDPGLTSLEAIPDSGSILVFLDPDSSVPGPVHLLQSQFLPPDSRAGGSLDRRTEIGIERGAPPEHEAAAELRDPAMKAIERTIERALGAWPRAWQADYL
jgi:FAD/FMN-containing dehydrogenase